MKIQIEVPDEVVKFLEAVSEFSGEKITIEKFTVEALLDRLQATVRSIASPFWSPKAIAVKYGLDKLSEDLKNLSDDSGPIEW